MLARAGVPGSHAVNERAAVEVLGDVFSLVLESQWFHPLSLAIFNILHHS